MDSTLILSAVDAVTKKWTKQRKAEERGRARARRETMTRSPRALLKYAAWRALPDAYQKASGGGKYPVAARQLYYAARPHVLEETGQSAFDSAYFTQRILPDYIVGHPKETATWDVVYDARGHFEEPHTRRITPLGTLDVRSYLGKIADHTVEEIAAEDFRADDTDFPTCGPTHRFGAVLFIEKEGFLPLFQAVKLAERHDIAVMSTKGMPVVACRRLADELCGRHDIPLLVLHDFDKAGFSIVGTLQGIEKEDRNYNPIAPRYEYRHKFDAIDLGIRLEDVEEWGLESEPVHYRSDPSDNLGANGATPEEIKFLCGANSWDNLRGRRVELNAFTSGDLIEWIEAKLKAHGIKKVLPDSETLEVAYRRAVQCAAVESRLDDILAEAAAEAEAAPVPKNLAKKIGKALKDNPEQPWDASLVKIVMEARD